MRNWICRTFAIAGMFSVCFVPDTARAGWFGPRNYDECVLNSIKDASNTAAVGAVYKSCEKLFPPQTVLLPAAAQKKVFVSSVVFEARRVEVIIRNVNPDWTIDSLVVMFIEEPGRPGTVRMFRANEKVAVGSRAIGWDVTDTIPGSTDLSVSFELDPSKAYAIMLPNQDIKGHR